ncbi:hypothetical protein BX666DRAFT_1899270 [Dichotomocladium elegans]|nr:hypothetical protein BX666DRAFT_1899270 [Dichotomocladium elegans]
MAATRSISIRIVNIDHYLCKPGPLDRSQSPFSSTPLAKVPIIRIFGSTPSGQKACLHIHQVYPYFYVPYQTTLTSSEEIQRDIYSFGVALNQAIRLSKARRPNSNGSKDVDQAADVGLNRRDDDEKEDEQFIAAIMLVKGVAFYGYHAGHQTYLKIYLLNPSDKHRTVDLLQNGTINGRVYQPHEAHISFELQFMMDYNLFGMDWIHVDSLADDDPQLSFRFRGILSDEPKTKRLISQQNISFSSFSAQEEDVIFYTAKSVPAGLHWDELNRSSYCELELDTTVMAIRNRLDLDERDMHTRLLDESAIDPSEKLIKSLASIWDDERRRRKARGEDMPSFTQDNEERLSKHFWHEDSRWRRALDRYIHQERQGVEDGQDHPESLSGADLTAVPTAFRAVEALYPDAYYRHINQPDIRLQRTTSGDYLFSDFISSPFDKSSHDPTSIQQNATKNVDADRIRMLVETDSFHDEGIKDEEMLEMMQQFDDDQLIRENREEENQLTDFLQEDNVENDALMNGNRSIQISYEKEELQRSERNQDRGVIDISDELSSFFRPRKLDFSIYAGPSQGYKNHSKKDEDEQRAVEYAEEEDEPQISDIPPSTPLKRHKRKRAHLPQFDGTGDMNDNSPTGSIKRSMEGKWRRATQHLRGVKRPWDFKSQPYVAIPPHPGLTRFIKRKSRTEVEDQSQEHKNEEEKQVTSREYIYAYPPPRVEINHVKYQEPYYSNPVDVPAKPKVFAGKEFRLVSNNIRYLEQVRDTYFEGDPDLWKRSRITIWEPAQKPPSAQQVRQDLEAKKRQQQKSTDLAKLEGETQRQYSSMLDGPTELNTFNFQYSLTKPKSRVSEIRNNLDLFSVEIHVNTRDDFLPDPEHDAVQIVFWCLQTEDVNIVSNGFQKGYHVGIIAIGNRIETTKIGIHDVETTYVQTETELLLSLVDKVRLYDPDFLVGYELNNSSWGYLIERAAILRIHLIDELSRNLSKSNTIHLDRWGYRKASIFRVSGRHMINVWRIMRSELNLTSYTFEKIAYQLLHCRTPHFPHRILTAWYTNGAPVLKYRLYRYYLDRVQMNLDMLDVSECIRRTSESARVFGVDFYSVITRGSQFKVESMMLRLAKAENYILISPSRKQVGEQRAAECLPLVMEPKTEFFSSPLLVLDFQSLYPSVMIAYNYCYSTCLGKVRSPGDPPRFGVTTLDIPPDLLSELKDDINISPNGVMFVKPSIRKSLLAKMLEEILSTRVMIKTSMKEYKDDSGLLRLLEAKQLTLKYIANVTYGYTAATFSGRMPGVEIADSIVQTGRQTLEKTIATINESKEWNAQVVYGDTDSVFVYLPGRTRDEAFKIGNSIAETITSMNPSPVRLKFEKVYHPCILLAKKRYVGFKYEYPKQEVPEFDAKGIETVRRDGTPATQKILEAGLKILFRTQDMSELKQYLYRQWTKILSNRVPLQDFVIAKEVRLGTYSEQHKPNGAVVAEAQMAKDPRAVPQYGERVPYVVVFKGPNALLRDKVVRPEAIIADNSLLLDGEYYIRKQIIPPLSRVFNLVGVDINAWYDEMPKQQKASALASARYPTREISPAARRIDQYYASSHCVVCRCLTKNAICDNCQANLPKTIMTLRARQIASQAKLANVLQVCETCSRVSSTITAPTDRRAAIDDTGYADHPCDSLDCPVFFERIKAKNDVCATITYDDLISNNSKESTP